MDKEYVDARNALIPQAERAAANAVAGLDLEREETKVLWNRTFHQTMDELWRNRR